MIKSIVKKGEYFDSVSLMIVGKEVSALPEVDEATVVMATAENKAILKTAGLYLDEFQDYDDTDLLIVVKSENNEAMDEIFSTVNTLLDDIRNRKSDQSSFAPKSIEGAIKMQPEANLALISLAGRYAGEEAMKALKQDLNVMLFSDNVSLETEIELKKYALSKDLLMMGPDCGTAIINGVPLAFSNAVNKGNIGLVAASGTGLQEVSSIISEEGFGISQAIGTGGRDVKEAVGGIMFTAAMEALNDDPETKVIVLVSKPPHPSVLEKIKAVTSIMSKPIVSIFLGADKKLLNDTEIVQASNLEEAALIACALANDENPDKVQIYLSQRKSDYVTIAMKAKEIIGKSRKYVRGLFSGGTLCDESLINLSKDLYNIYSNRAAKNSLPLEDASKSIKHTLIDLGEDEFTVGRLHPMMDFELRNNRILQEARDNETAIILFDLVLGYGAHPDPLSQIIPILEEAQKIAPDIAFICSVTGTEKDPQDREAVINALENIGVFVLPSSYAAAEVTKIIIKKIDK